MHSAGHRKIIARGLSAEVEHCAACDIIQLHIGAFTLRLKPAVLHDLHDTLVRALEKLPPGKNPDDRDDDELRSGGSCH
jgi:hypothetical protein